jgi:hypothetical protein
MAVKQIKIFRSPDVDQEKVEKAVRDEVALMSGLRHRHHSLLPYIPRNRVTRWVCEKIALKVAQPAFVSAIFNATKIGLLLQQFSKNRPKVDNHPMGANSPNLVTLPRKHLDPPPQKKGGYYL